MGPDAISVSTPVLLAVVGMFVTIMGGLLHVIFRLGSLVQKVESLEEDLQELRRYVFPVPHAVHTTPTGGTAA